MVPLELQRRSGTVSPAPACWLSAVPFGYSYYCASRYRIIIVAIWARFAVVLGFRPLLSP